MEQSLATADLPSLLSDATHVFHLAAQAGVRKSWGRDFQRLYSQQRGSHADPPRGVHRQADRAVRVRVQLVDLWRRSDAAHARGCAASTRITAGVTKLAAEQLCYLYYVNHSVPTVALRYFTVYGPRQRPDMGFSRFFEAVLRDEPVPIFGDGRQTRDFTFVADAVSATLASATRGTPGGVYNIGGGSRVELLDVFELIRIVTGRALRFSRLEAQRGDMRDTYADTTRARTDLAFAPTVTLEQGLRAQYEWITASNDKQ